MVDFLTTLPILLVLLALTSWVVRRFAEGERPALWLSFVAHQVSAIGLIVMNQSYYGDGDMLGYQRWGIAAADQLAEDFFGVAPALVGLILQRPDPLPIPLPVLPSNTGSMQGIAAFAMFFFNNSLYAACAAIGGAAFFSKLALYSTARAELPDISQRALLVACMLVPSAVFWSSGLLKEPFAVMGLFVCVYAWHRFVNGPRRIRALLLLGASAALMGLLKGYILPAFGVATALWYLARAINARRGDFVVKTGHMVVASGLGAMAVIGTGILLPEFAVESFNDEVVGLQTIGARLEGGSNYSLGAGSGSDSGQLGLLPMGLLTALFRPVLFEVTNPLVFLNAVEMTVFSVLLFLAARRQGIAGTFREIFRRPILSFCCIFVLMFGTGVGVASTNLGSLSRYRSPMMPFFAILLVTLSRRKAPEESEAEPGHAPRREAQPIAVSSQQRPLA